MRSPHEGGRERENGGTHTGVRAVRSNNTLHRNRVDRTPLLLERRVSVPCPGGTVRCVSIMSGLQKPGIGGTTDFDRGPEGPIGIRIGIRYLLRSVGAVMEASGTATHLLVPNGAAGFARLSPGPPRNIGNIGRSADAWFL